MIRCGYTTIYISCNKPNTVVAENNLYNRWIRQRCCQSKQIWHNFWWQHRRVVQFSMAQWLLPKNGKKITISKCLTPFLTKTKQLLPLYKKTSLFMEWKTELLVIIYKDYSKASRYTASSCMDLDNARFWIGSKKIWDARIYVVKTLSCTVFWCSCLCLIK